MRALRLRDAASLAVISRRLGGTETEADWSRLLDPRAPAAAVAAEAHGDIVGYAAGTVRVAFGGSAPVGWIEMFGVDVSWRGRGIGRLLADALLARFRELGAARACTLVPLHDRELAPFFRELGFREQPAVCLGRPL